ncbi:TPA: phage protein D, partial [Escherichia coli]|nr:phage protein D [Escherichia coli]
HAFERNSGYTTELEVARGPVTQGKAKKGKKNGKTRTLTIYKPDGSTSTVIREKKK